MIIVLFHALYLFGRYVYDRFHPREDEADDNNIEYHMINVSEADYADLEQPEHDSNTVNMNIKFFPPVYVQRYNSVQNVLTSDPYIGKIHKVIDFGCAELSFTIHLKNTDGVREIYCVDIDRSLLENFQSKVAPLHCDYLSLRTEPLTINVCEGSIAHNDNKLSNSDAVICIELIEHLYPDDLDAFPHNVFGFIKPLVAIVTTPNADFNVLFNLGTGFRHDDHKFEWTRKQFQDWGNNIISRYPEYEVSFHGIGAGPPGTEHLGTCSQMAVFHRLVENDVAERPTGIDGLLKTVASHEYPYHADNRSDEQKILDEAVYYIKLYSARYEDMSEEIPLKQLMFSVEKFCISVEILKNILEEANWAIEERENGPVVLIPPASGFSSHSGDDLDDFLDNDYRHHGDDDDWDNLETSMPSAAYFVSRSHEVEENWDEETRDTQHSDNSNLNSQHLLNTEPFVSENADPTSDSQWTIEDIINEDPLLDTSQNQPSLAINSFGIETELPSNSLSIELDCTDIDNLNISNDTLDSSEHHLSSPFPALDLSEASQSLGTESCQSFAVAENPAFFNKSYKRRLVSEETNSGNCVKDTKSLKFDSEACANPVSNSKQPKKVRYDSTYDIEEFQSPVATDNPRLISRDSPSLYSEPAAIDDIDAHSGCDGTSSVSTVEAAGLISEEQSLLIDSTGHPLNAEGPSQHEKILTQEKEKVKPQIDNSVDDRDISSLLSDKTTPENGDRLNLEDSFAHTKHEASYSSVKDLSSTTNDSYKNINVSIDSIDSNYQKCESELIDTRLMMPDDIRSQDSLSFKSISSCSLDIRPKYTSSPQTSTDICSTEKYKDNNTQRTEDNKSTVLGMIQDSDCTSTVKKVAEDSVDNFSTSPSQLSPRSNSNVSLSTATSTGSSNVEKWYAAETNPMYKRDLGVLKGGNDTADYPNEETTSDSDATVSGSDRGKDREPIKNIDRRSKRSERYRNPKKNNQPQDNLDEDIADSLETVTIVSDHLVRGKTDKLPCHFFESPNVGMNVLSPNVLDSSNEGTAHSDSRSDCRVEKISENESGKTNDVLSSPIVGNSFVNREDLGLDLYGVTKSLEESTKKMLEKVDATKQKVEYTLESTKTSIPQTSGVIHSSVPNEMLEIVKNFNEPVKMHEIIPESVPISSLSTSVLPMVQELNNKHHSPNRPNHSIDVRPCGFPKEIENADSPTSDIVNTHVHYGKQLQSTISSCVVTPESQVSTSYSVSKIAKEKNQSKSEFNPMRGTENMESQQFSPESLDTPPNSWSPEIMDSGYPNSVSVHDITPEYELSSIANDRISDSDSASVGEEVPVPGIYENIEVENGDLANNNRDDEGNNVLAFEADDLDDLQPLIDVLENDMENENDIYVLQNGFPMWLLRILEMANPLDLEGRGGPQAQLYPAPLDQAGGDAPNVNINNDEGFDSSSSDDDSDIEDDEADDVTTISSDETEDPSAEDLRRDWRAGGDP